MSVSELKEVQGEINDKINQMVHFAALQTGLEGVNQELQRIEEILAEGGMAGLSYTDKSDDICEVVGAIGRLNAYIGTMESEALEQLDKPLYRVFVNVATEMLSQIKSNNYSTNNTLGIKDYKVRYDRNGNRIDRVEEKATLTLEDFLGVTSIKKGKQDYIVNMPKEFQDFSNMFQLDYEKLQKDGKMKGIGLEEYLTKLSTLENFDHKMDKPFLQFFSQVMDMTVIKPILEICTGYDVVTGEDLSDLERGMKGVYLVVDVITMFMGFKGSMALKMSGKQVVKLVGKTIALDMVSCGASYGVSKLCEELNLPLPLTLILSGMVGISVAKSGGKYLFKNSADEIIYEASQEAIEVGLKKVKKGAGGAKTIPQKLTQEGQVPAIGKMKDLNTSGNVIEGEFKVADYLPDLGNPKANWKQNDGILRSVMNEKVPIKDVSMFPMDNAGFLGAERNLLQSRGWTYLDGYWYPPL